MQVNFQSPHDPFLITPAMRSAVVGRTVPAPVDNTFAFRSVSGYCGPDLPLYSNSHRCNYMALIERLDHLFGKLVSAVEAQGAGANTIVCVSSDHGEMLGDHNVYEKSRPWEGSVAVPLICKGPGIRGNVTVSQPVSWVDLSATFLDFAAVNPKVTQKKIGMDAMSLRPFMARGVHPDYRTFVHSGLDKTMDNDPWRAVVALEENTTKIFKYICCQGICSGVPSTITPAQKKAPWMHWLTEVTTDPFDMHNLVQAKPAMVQRLRDQLPEPFRTRCASI